MVLLKCKIINNILQNFHFISHPIRVRYADTDQMGFVHHSNYLRYFEIARLEWLRKLGFSYKTMEENKFFLPVASATVQYKKPCYFDDLLKVCITLTTIPQASLDFEYSIYNEKEELVATGTTRLAFFNAITKTPTRCPKELAVCFQSVLEANQS